MSRFKSNTKYITLNILLLIFIILLSYIKVINYFEQDLSNLTDSVIFEYISFHLFVILGIVITIFLEVLIIVNIEKVVFQIYNLDVKNMFYLYTSYLFALFIFILITCTYSYFKNFNIMIEVFARFMMLFTNIFIVNSYISKVYITKRKRIFILFIIGVIMAFNSLISLLWLYVS